MRAFRIYIPAKPISRRRSAPAAVRADEAEMMKRTGVHSPTTTASPSHSFSLSLRRRSSMKNRGYIFKSGRVPRASTRWMRAGRALCSPFTFYLFFFFGVEVRRGFGAEGEEQSDWSQRERAPLVFEAVLIGAEIIKRRAHSHRLHCSLSSALSSPFPFSLHRSNG